MAMMTQGHAVIMATEDDHAWDHWGMSKGRIEDGEQPSAYGQQPSRKPPARRYTHLPGGPARLMARVPMLPLKIA